MSFSKNPDEDSIFMTTCRDDFEGINEELDVSNDDLVNNIPPPLRRKSEI